MNSSRILFFVFLCFCVLSFSLNNIIDNNIIESPFYHPKGWPKPTYYFKGNPIDGAKFELGRALFYDPILSRDSTISCASCHLQYTAFAHVDHATSHGIEGRIGKRNAPGLANLAWRKLFHWDGGVLNLNGQAINPITHVDEMDMALDSLMYRLDRSPRYSAAFKRTFGTDDIRPFHLVKALAQFTVALVSADSKYDKVQRGEDGIVFTDQEKKGLTLFNNFCSSCHKAPFFGGDEFKYNGLPIDPNLLDFGRMTITENKKDSLLFMVPSLRNVEYSFPYMHDGRIAKLKDVIKHYTLLDYSNPLLSKELRKKPVKLSDNEQKDLLAFLKTLTDKTFLFDERFKYSIIN
jgi:cytochrome c peroxidase